MSSLSSISLTGDSSSYLSFTNVPDLQFGTGDFTIQWYQKETDNNPFPRVFGIGTYPATTIGVSIEGGGSFYYWSGGPHYMTYVPKNVWVHLAITRVNGILRVFKDGVFLSGPSFTDSNNITGSQNLIIGNESAQSNSAAFGGLIYEFTWLKGTGLYTTDFRQPIVPSTGVAALLLYGNNYLGTLGSTVNAQNVSTDPDFPIFHYGGVPERTPGEITNASEFDQDIADVNVTKMDILDNIEFNDSDYIIHSDTKKTIITPNQDPVYLYRV